MILWAFVNMSILMYPYIGILVTLLKKTKSFPNRFRKKSAITKSVAITNRTTNYF